MAIGSDILKKMQPQAEPERQPPPAKKPGKSVQDIVRKIRKSGQQKPESAGGLA